MKKRLKNTEPIPDDVTIDPFMTFEQWSAITGIKVETLKSRFKAGWPIEEVFYRKVRYHKANKSKFDDCIYEKVGEIAKRPMNDEWTKFTKK